MNGAVDFTPRMQASAPAAGQDSEVRVQEPPRQQAEEFQPAAAPSEMPPARVERVADVPAFNLTPPPTSVAEASTRAESDPS